MAEGTQEAAPSTATDVAREAGADPDPQPARAAEQAPPETPSPPPFDADSLFKQLESAPDDVYDRLVQLDPLRKRVSAESSRAIQRAQQAARQEREQREALERDLILADEEHDQHYDYAQKYGTEAVEAARQRVGIRAALEQPAVKAQANAEAAWNILVAVADEHGLSEQDVRECFSGDPSVNPNAGRDGVLELFRRAIKADRAAWEPQARQHAVDEFRARVLPNADLGGSRSGPPSGGLTLAGYREMRLRGDPALKAIPAAEIDRLSAELLRDN